MIKRAVEQRPDDGYIVDLTWLGLLPDRELRHAVKNLEQALIDLKQPRTPRSTIISAMPTGGSAARWRAEFQRAHARDLKPEPGRAAEKIEAKIESGPARRHWPRVRGGKKEKKREAGGKGG